MLHFSTQYRRFVAMGRMLGTWYGGLYRVAAWPCKPASGLLVLRTEYAAGEVGAESCGLVRRAGRAAAYRVRTTGEQPLLHLKNGDDRGAPTVANDTDQPCFLQVLQRVVDGVDGSAERGGGFALEREGS